MAIGRITAHTKESKIKALFQAADWGFLSFTLSGSFDYGEMIMVPDMNWEPYTRLIFRDIRAILVSPPTEEEDEFPPTGVCLGISFPASEGTGESPLRVTVGLCGYISPPHRTLTIDCSEIEFEECPR